MFPTGWVPNPKAVAAYLEERRVAGDQPVLADVRPDLKGYWPRLVMSGTHAVLPYQCELELFGEFRPADFQKRGTCVSRGTYRACQDSHYWDIVKLAVPCRPVEWSYEAIYGGARTVIGKRQIHGDGLVGAWAARWVHDYGLTPRGLHGAYDLSVSNEDFAVGWGDNGVPAEVIAAGKEHRVKAHYTPTVDDLADVTAAGYCTAICSTHQFSDRRDENGMCSYKGPTNHCQEICGVFMLPSWNGRPETILEHTGFVDQQSWGNIPAGPDRLRMYGATAKLRQGAYGLPSALMIPRIKTGEMWTFGCVQGVRPQSLSELD